MYWFDVHTDSESSPSVPKMAKEYPTVCCLGLLNLKVPQLKEESSEVRI